ncbi:MAG: fumarylacetoacetate hydrolase family protein [Asticcacaulis sp.]
MNDKSRVYGIGVFQATEGPAFTGLVVDGRVAPVSAFGLSYETVSQIYADWSQAEPKLAAAAEAFSTVESVELSTLRALAPAAPAQIICAGANYRKHVLDIIVAEAKRNLPEGKSAADMLADGERFMSERAEKGQPYAWIKANGALSGASDNIVIPSDVKRCDWELELALVIGKRAHRVKRETALDYVAGYTIGNDISARDFIYREDMKKIGTDWLAAKGRPGFLPLGPYVTPARFVPDPQALTITLKHNGRVMQNEAASDMLFDVARLIEYMSGLVVLEPGDVILTGSPAGNGEHWGVYMQPGDVIESTISGAGVDLGYQRNLCVAE